MRKEEVEMLKKDEIWGRAIAQVEKRGMKPTNAWEVVERYTKEEKEEVEWEYYQKGWMRWGACGCGGCRLAILKAKFGNRTKPDEYVYAFG